MMWQRISKAGFMAVGFMAAISVWAEDRRSAEVSPQRELYMVSTAHLDTQWTWPITDTIDQCIPDTFNQNFALFEKYPNYIFSFEGAFRYMLMKEYYPQAYERVKGYVAQGRWRVAGSCVDAGDTNIPSPESLIRHILYGNGYFEDEFGQTSCDIFLPDSFGFSYVLPSVAAHCELNGFSTQKLGWGAAIPVPFDIGVWEGPDGASLIASLWCSDYNTKIRANLSEDPNWIKRIDAIGKDTGVFKGYGYYGIGDRGGATDPESAQWLETSMADRKAIKVKAAASDQLFRDLTPEQIAKLPRYKGELIMRQHGTGCYTAQAPMKRWNRMNEQLGDAAERAAVMADWLGAASYPKEQLKESWIRFLWHQFHDDLPGTSTPHAYTYSWNDVILSLNQFAATLAESAGGVCRALDTRGQGVPVVVYNPLSFEREDVVQAKVAYGENVPSMVQVYDDQGQALATQVLSRKDGEMEILFIARVPSVGFRVFDVRKASAAETSSVSANKNGLENACYKVQLDPQGNITSIYDKRAAQELLAEPLRWEMYAENKPLVWAAWEIFYEYVTAAPETVLNGPATVEVVEQGPVRASVKITREVRGSTVSQTISLLAGGSAPRIEFDHRMDWKTPLVLLKALFPVTVKNAMATYDLGLGTVQRGNNTKDMYEVPAQQWADLSGPEGDRGVAILSDYKCGWDKPSDNLLRLTLSHNPLPSSDPADSWVMHQKYQEFGRHQFKYAIYGHAGDWLRGGVPEQAMRFNQPLMAFQAPKHEGALGKAFSMLSVSCPGVVVRAVKQAEKSREMVIRLQNLSPDAVEQVKVAFAQPVVAAREVWGSEKIKGPGVIVEGKLVVDMKPYQPATYIVTLAVAPVVLTSPVSKPLTLDYNVNVVSADGQAATGGFDQRGYFIPRELYPATLNYRNIAFNLGPAGGNNAVICQGQKISLPQEKGMTKVYLLAASAQGDAGADFMVDGQARRINVAAGAEFVGQADSRFVNGELVQDASRMTPGFIKRDAVAWVSTHLHDAQGKNRAYQQGYFFMYSLEISPQTREIILPSNDRIRIMAISLADNANNVTPAQELFN